MKIVENRNKYFIVSTVIIIIGFAMMIVNAMSGKGAFNYDVEFSGGTSLQIDIGKDFNNDDITAIIKTVTGQDAPQVQKISGSKEVLVKMKSIDQPTRVKLIDQLKAKYGITDKEVTFGDVSATVSGEMQKKAISAVAVASICMLLYISLRFKDFKKGGSAILAVLHDILFMLTAYAVLRIPLNYAFIAAILTILGYSINNTIVIFDRVRENEKRMNRPELSTLINVSVTQTLRRSIFTSMTVFIVLLCLYLLGVQSIKDFTLPLIIGVVGGAYSSVCVAGSFWYIFCDGKRPIGR